MSINRIGKQLLSLTNTWTSQSRRIHFGPTSSVPLAESLTPSWPNAAAFSGDAEVVLPKRTVPDSALKFTLRATFDHGTAIHYPHLKFNPADFKVKMTVRFGLRK